MNIDLNESTKYLRECIKIYSENLSNFQKMQTTVSNTYKQLLIEFVSFVFNLDYAVNMNKKFYKKKK